MKVLTLSDGRKAKLFINHRRFADRRGTETQLVLGDYSVIGRAVCNPGDNFCRRTGRRMAAARLVAACRCGPVVLSKQDRALVFRAVCPEYSS